MLRRATIQDVPAVIDLRAAFFATMGHQSDPDAPWGAPAARWFAEHLGIDACAYLAYDGDQPVATAVGYLQIAPPSPSNPAGVRGYLSDVITLPGHRRRGHARRCVDALITWFRDETPAELVDLTASTDGVALYESLGWARRDQPLLRLRLDQPRH